jgi:ribosome-associated translation inhibitor RaiA
METPLRITTHQIALSETIETKIREKAAKLERYYESIVSCL